MLKEGNIKFIIFINIILILIWEVLCKFLSVTLEINLLVIFLLFLINLTYLLCFYFLFRKLKMLSKSMNDILNDNYSFLIKTYNEGIVSSLNNDIYKMTVKLKESRDISIKDKEYLEEILSEISHQIKTPITSMYIINDILCNDQLDNSKRHEFVLKNKKEIERIEWLVSSLLKMSRLDSNVVKLNICNVSVLKLIENSLEPIKVSIELKNINVDLSSLKDFDLNVDYLWTSEALLNIIKNAYEHTKEYGNICISSNDTPIYSEIIIKDNGCGISKEDLPNIFKRFYKSCSSSKDSIGIGLYMTKKIIDMENGDIKVYSNKSGTTFRIRFYKNNL